jgi:hypothetical protein
MAMIKTTIYLTDQLKADLERVSAEWNQSKADVIREGIRLAVDAHTRPAPRSGIFRSGITNFAKRSEELLHGFGEV